MFDKTKYAPYLEKTNSEEWYHVGDFLLLNNKDLDLEVEDLDKAMASGDIKGTSLEDGSVVKISTTYIGSEFEGKTYFDSESNELIALEVVKIIEAKVLSDGESGPDQDSMIYDWVSRGIVGFIPMDKLTMSK